jgi:hypothetical protein
MLARHLSSLRDPSGGALYDVSAKDRVVTPAGDDLDLERLAGGAFDQLWLFGVDNTGALTERDIGHIEIFQERGGGVFLTRDHQDLGSCLSRLGVSGRTQYFQTVNPETDETRRCCDDIETTTITWPNYHSGRNGDLQPVTVPEPAHPLMQKPSGGMISRLPAHPHEGAVGCPPDVSGVAKVVATGRSQTSGVVFNLCVAVEQPGLGRGVSDSSFHHLADYNWDPRMGCPSFVTELAGDEVIRDSHALDDVRAYVANIASWLAGRL